MRHIYRYKDNAEFEEKDGLTKCLSCNRIMEGKVDECTNPDCPDPTNVVFEEKARRKTTGLCGVGTDDTNLEVHWEPDVEDRLIITYNVTSTTESTRLMSNPDFLSAITEMRLDTGELITPVTAYTFDRTGLRTVYFSITVGSINGSVFNGTIRIVSVEFPKKIKTLNGGVFYNNDTLQEIWIPESGITSIYSDSTFQSCDNIRRIKFPETMVKLANGTFNGCSKIKELVFPKKLIEVRSGCFQNCTSLEKVTFMGTGFSVIGGGNIFNGCTKLSTIIFYGTTCTNQMGRNSGDGFYAGLPENGTLYVPHGCSNVQNFRYVLAKLPAGWQIVEMDE